MKCFRLFRSKAFWFGVPGLVGLLWGWWVSMGYRSWVEFETWGVGLSAGEVYAYWFLEAMPGWGDMGVGHCEVEPEEVLEWKRMLVDSPHVIPDFRLTFIPLYWPVLGYLALWIGLLIWRKRRFEKRMNE